MHSVQRVCPTSAHLTPQTELSAVQTQPELNLLAVPIQFIQGIYRASPGYQQGICACSLAPLLCSLDRATNLQARKVEVNEKNEIK